MTLRCLFLGHRWRVTGYEQHFLLRIHHFVCGRCPATGSDEPPERWDS
jgi:hypothetical protein